jgi:hypothetical protein
MPAVQKADNQPSSRPESRITDQRLAFSNQNPFIEFPYKIARKQPKVSIVQFPQGFFFLENFPLAARSSHRPRPKHNV